jgi:hypothetical protein
MLEITQSTLSLIVLLLTSATFRLILSALLATAQELVASTKKAVEDVAGQLEVGAQQVEKIAVLIISKNLGKQVVLFGRVWARQVEMTLLRD